MTKTKIEYFIIGFLLATSIFLFISATEITASEGNKIEMESGRYQISGGTILDTKTGLARSFYFGTGASTMVHELDYTDKTVKYKVISKEQLK